MKRLFTAALGVGGMLAGITNFSIPWVVAREVAPVPIRAALPLLMPALGVFGFFEWRRKKAVAV